MSKAPNGPATPPEDAAEPDPSMDDILASIRRILDEDQAGKGPPEDVLMLEPSMLVDEPAASPPSPSPSPEPEPLPAPSPPSPLAEASRPAMIQAVSDDPFPPLPAREAAADEGSGLVAPAAAAAAASSLGALRRTLAADRHAVVRSSGPSFEDIVREEMRPMLKAWLDTHLPPLVERLVKAEIERVIDRQAG